MHGMTVPMGEGIGDGSKAKAAAAFGSEND
jgi:hypothetical protein